MPLHGRSSPIDNVSGGVLIAWGACVAGLLLPWLNPYAGGPSASITPWLFSALCSAIVYGTQRLALPHPVLPAALASLAAWAIVRTGWSPDTLAVAAASLLIFLLASVAAGGWRRPEFVRAVALAWLLAAAASTVIALCQYFGLADKFPAWMNGSTAGEAFGNLRQRNQFASLTVIGMATLFWWMPGGLNRWLGFAAIALLAAGNAATTSRTGLAQMVLIGLLAGVWPGARCQRMALWLTGLLAYGLAALALPWLLEIVTGVAGNRLWERVAGVDACSSRRVLWSNVLHLIGQKPWSGWGWDELDYAHFANLYDGPRFCDILDNAHNLPLHLAVELGIPYALLVCGGLLLAIVKAAPWREADATRQMAWAVLTVIAVHSMLEYPLWYGPFQIAFGVCLGLLWPARARLEAPAATAHGGFSTVSVAVAICAVAAWAYATWDYHRVSQIYLPPEARSAGYADDPLPKIRRSWLFRNQARFAELTIHPLTRDDAQWTYDAASDLLHYSPEPRVIEKLIESATRLGRHEEALLNTGRYRAAFPEAYATWAKAVPPAEGAR
jgi:O-antigen ligase